MSFLYLKNEPVIQLKDSSHGFEIHNVINKELLPLCLLSDCSSENFNKWLSKRKIPDRRDGLAAVNERFGTSWMNNINYLSLTDHYWIRKREEKWKAINYFTNRYSQDIGNMFFAPWKVSTSKFAPSPDLTCGGILKKRWKQKDDRTSYLIKAGSVVARQEPLSEVLVSVLCERLKKIKCVKYELHVEGVVMCSKCDNFVTEGTDFVPASYIYSFEKRPSDVPVLNHLLKMCEKFNVPGAEEYLKWTIFVDNITGNEDRNLNNIGFLRDINTLQFIGPAPLFDSGNAYWDSSLVNKEKKSKCFAQSEKFVVAELKKELDPSCLDDASYEDLIYKYPELEDQRKESLIKAISKRNDRLLGKVKDAEIDRDK